MLERKKNRICSIKRCSCCDGFNMQYRYVNIHLNKASLATTLQLIYEYDQLDENYKRENSLGIRFGLAFISIMDEDYFEVKQVVEDAVLKLMKLPEFS